jgi:rhodanese-related sulfurtransferase
MTRIIDRSTLQRRLAEPNPPVLAEALPEKYYQDWHLPAARHLPHDQVRALAADRLPQKSAEIVVYCASRTCQNSHIAAAILEQMGYTNVAVYAGGKEDWQAAGLPVERGEPSAVAA